MVSVVLYFYHMRMTTYFVYKIHVVIICLIEACRIIRLVLAICAR